MAPFRQMNTVVYTGWEFAFTVNLGQPPEGNPEWVSGKHNLDTVQAWCVQNFGPPVTGQAKAPFVGWALYGWTFTFNNLGEATAFKIRWC